MAATADPFASVLGAGRGRNNADAFLADLVNDADWMRTECEDGNIAPLAGELDRALKLGLGPRAPVSELMAFAADHAAEAIFDSWTRDVHTSPLRHAQVRLWGNDFNCSPWLVHLKGPGRRKPAAHIIDIPHAAQTGAVRALCGRGIELEKGAAYQPFLAVVKSDASKPVRRGGWVRPSEYSMLRCDECKAQTAAQRLHVPAMHEASNTKVFDELMGTQYDIEATIAERWRAEGSAAAFAAAHEQAHTNVLDAFAHEVSRDPLPVVVNLLGPGGFSGDLTDPTQVEQMKDLPWRDLLAPLFDAEADRDHTWHRHSDRTADVDRVAAAVAQALR